MDKNKYEAEFLQENLEYISELKIWKVLMQLTLLYEKSYLHLDDQWVDRLT